MSDLYIEDRLIVDGDIVDGDIHIAVITGVLGCESAPIDKQEAQQIVEHLTRVFDLTPT